MDLKSFFTRRNSGREPILAFCTDSKGELSKSFKSFASLFFEDAYDRHNNRFFDGATTFIEKVRISALDFIATIQKIQLRTHQHFEDTKN